MSDEPGGPLVDCWRIARQLHTDLEAANAPTALTAKVQNAVCRPLELACAASHRQLEPEEGGQAKDETEGDPHARLRSLAKSLGDLYEQDPDPRVLMALSAVLDAAGELGWETTLSESEASQLGARRLEVVPGGPHVLVGDARLLDDLGAPLGHRDLTALCRCGQSLVKPRCDGVCLRDGFEDAKDPRRVPDRLDVYGGVSVGITDNRGTCQHSGLCTDRLRSVFRLGEEPFVLPSGGRMDDIVRAVRACPSGALSLTFDGIEAREIVDHNSTRLPEVEVSKDGPYRVTGGLPIVDVAGGEVPQSEGASREHFALCRCGHSQNKPFCSGMHWYVGFSDPERETTEQTVFSWAGGTGAFDAVTRIFYGKYVPEDPLLGPLFADMSADHPERVARWLAEVFGGPKQYSETYGGYPQMLAHHVGKRLTEAQRSRWVELLSRSVSDAGLPNDAEFRAALSSYLEWGSRLAVENSQTDSRPPQNMPMPHWGWSTTAGAPWGRVSALERPNDEQRAVELPASNEQVGFEKHVRSMFRDGDRRSMLFAFDLWAVTDVRVHATSILDRLENGSMPCDGRWDDSWIAVFRRWVGTGMAD